MLPADKYTITVSKENSNMLAKIFNIFQVFFFAFILLARKGRMHNIYKNEDNQAMLSKQINTDKSKIYEFILKLGLPWQGPL